MTTPPDKKTSSATGGYTSSLMNWRPFRKSRDETADGGRDSPPRKTSLTGGSSTLGRTGSRAAQPSLASSNLKSLGSSTNSLKRSTSSVASLTPLRVKHFDQLLARKPF